MTTSDHVPRKIREKEAEGWAVRFICPDDFGWIVVYEKEAH